MRHIWICLPVALCYPAMAQSSPALVREALQNNREIPRQRPSGASSLPDPTVSLGCTSNGSPLPGGGLGSNPTGNAGVRALGAGQLHARGAKGKEVQCL